MQSLSVMMRVLWSMVAALFVTSVNANYDLVDDYSGDNFSKMFDFITGDDPTHGYVNYVDRVTAIDRGLFNVTEDKSIYIGVDSKNVADGRGRSSIRLQSVRSYNHGLFILDLAHMPGNICGTWPAFWFMGNKGENWPKSGAINVIESANNLRYNLMALHTADNCSINNSTNTFTGELVSKNCFVQAPDQYGNQGCSIRAKTADAYGDEFNKNGGGIYAVNWSLYFIKIWHFPRSEIPENIKNGRPNPENWGKPLAEFAGHCDFTRKFVNQSIIFDITFCGDWAGNSKIWTQQCGDKDPSCTNYVQNNPEAFKETYWLVNSLKVYTTPLITTTGPPPTTTPPGIGLYVGVGVFVPLFIIVLASSLTIWCVCRRKQRKRRETIDSLASNAYRIFKNHWVLKVEKDLWEIKRDKIQIGKKIGAGAFADVHAGKLIGESGIKRVYDDSITMNGFYNCDVAVKMMQMIASKEAKEDFQEEINFMKSLKYHVNIVCLLGYVLDPPNTLLILEYCANGDLLHFLRAQKAQIIQTPENQTELEVKTLISFAWQISNGLDYFSSLGFIHRDVAARNILLDKNNVCKIGDFGLCRTMHSEIYKSKGGKTPIKWMPLEALKAREYSTKTDVWAYGILIFEIFSLGEVPYADLENGAVLEFLESGQRLQKPVYSTEEMYDLMLLCWQEAPKNRPTFTQICLLLTSILEHSNLYYGYVDPIRPIVQVSDIDPSIV